MVAASESAETMGNALRILITWEECSSRIPQGNYRPLQPAVPWGFEPARFFPTESGKVSTRHFRLTQINAELIIHVIDARNRRNFVPKQLRVMFGRDRSAQCRDAPVHRDIHIPINMRGISGQDGSDRAGNAHIVDLARPSSDSRGGTVWIDAHRRAR